MIATEPDPELVPVAPQSIRPVPTPCPDSGCPDNSEGDGFWDQGVFDVASRAGVLSLDVVAVGLEGGSTLLIDASVLIGCGAGVGATADIEGCASGAVLFGATTYVGTYPFRSLAQLSSTGSSAIRSTRDPHGSQLAADLSFQWNPGFEEPNTQTGIYIAQLVDDWGWVWR